MDEHIELDFKVFTFIQNHSGFSIDGTCVHIAPLVAYVEGSADCKAFQSIVLLSCVKRHIKHTKGHGNKTWACSSADCQDSFLLLAKVDFFTVLYSLLCCVIWLYIT